MDLITYAILKRTIKGLAATGGIVDISSDGNEIIFTMADGETHSIEIPSPEISINDNGNWVINGIDTGISTIQKMTLIEY